jgi:hypothetical protein
MQESPMMGAFLFLKGCSPLAELGDVKILYLTDALPKSRRHTRQFERYDWLELGTARCENAAIK